jgi:curved DNA-binding protein CbpA
MEKLEEALKELKNFDLYEILEIEKTDDQDIIKKAYKKLIKKYHPDKNKESNTVEKFDRIKLAYELLKNFELKALYDNKQKSKQERVIKKKEMDSKRRKFMEDLENKEKMHNNKRESEDNLKKEFSKAKAKDNKYKTHEEEYNKFFQENLFNRTEKIMKNKITIEDKLDKYGLKVINKFK